MIPAELIKKKRGGMELSETEIKTFVNGYVLGSVADYQMSAFLMAVYFRGMTKKETWSLTQAMLHSGTVVNFGDSTLRVDKHSTGGVGDKTSLIIAPIVAAAGIQVPMISGRGLGHTGGTLDKLESIPGFDVWLDLVKFQTQVKKLGACFIGQTKEICPADKKMYALRDVTGTVECIPLICASIMSKKLAEGIDGLVLDVKTGAGAFMKSKAAAQNLAKNLIEVGELGGKKVVALVTDMSQPLGNAIGNSLEVEECLETLSGRGPADLRELSIELSAHMILLGKKAKNILAARTLAKELLDTGAALTRFKEIVRAQNGNLDNLPKAKFVYEVLASRKGFVRAVQAEQIGIASLLLGAGRMRADDKIDHSAGIVVHKKVSDKVEKGEVIATLYYNTGDSLEKASQLVKEAVLISLQKVKRPRLIIKVMK